MENRYAENYELVKVLTTCMKKICNKDNREKDSAVRDW